MRNKEKELETIRDLRKINILFYFSALLTQLSNSPSFTSCFLPPHSSVPRFSSPKSKGVLDLSYFGPVAQQFTHVPLTRHRKAFFVDGFYIYYKVLFRVCLMYLKVTISQPWKSKTVVHGQEHSPNEWLLMHVS